MSLRFNIAEITRFDDCGDKLHITAIARHAGVLRYQNPDGSQRLEFVSPETNKALDSEGFPWVRQLGGAVATNEHPMRLINGDSELASQVKVGEVLPKVKIYNDGKVEVEVEVFDSETIDQIRTGQKTGLSLGYTTNVVREDGVWNGQPYTHKQIGPFVVDHVAICSRPRAPEALITRFDSCGEDVAVQIVDRPTKKKKKSSLFDDRYDANDKQLYQIEINGRPFLVPLDLYLAISAEMEDDDNDNDYGDSTMTRDSSKDEELLKALMDAKAKKNNKKAEDDEDIEEDDEDIDYEDEAFKNKGKNGKKDSATWMSDRLDSLESELSILRAKCDAQDKLLAKFDSIDLDRIVRDRVDSLFATYNALRPYLPEGFQLDGNVTVEGMKLIAIRELDSDTDVDEATPEPVLDSVLSVLTRYQHQRKDSIEVQRQILNKPSDRIDLSAYAEINNYYANAWKQGVAN